MRQSLIRGGTHLLFGIPAFLAVASLLAPLLEAGGWPHAAGRLYLLLSYVCHQIPSHSLWIFGAPTGVSSRSLFLYLGFVSAGVFMVQRRRLPAWPLSVLLLIPIWADGLTQLGGWREGSNLLRVVTGTLGGIGLAGLILRGWTRLAVSCTRDNPVFLTLLNRAMVGFLIVALGGGSFPYRAGTGQANVTIPEGTRVVIATVESLSSESAQRGDVVHFEVLRDVDVKGHVVIRAGASARGEVLRAAPKRMMGREGELLLGIRYVTALDGTQVPARASLEETGEDSLVSTVVLSVLLCPLFLTMKGGEAVMPEGTEFTVFVDRSVEVAMVERETPAPGRGSPPSMPTSTPQVSLEEQLERLKDMKAQGRITEEEHALLRKRLIEQFPVSTVTRATPKELIGVTGVWKGEWSAPEENQSGTIVLDLNQEGMKVTGTVSLEVPYPAGYMGSGAESSGVDYTEGQIKNGKMKGRILTFEVPGGTQAVRGRLVVKGSSMRGTLENLTAEIDTGKAVLKRE